MKNKIKRGAMNLIVLGLVYIATGCAFHKGADGSITADLGRDAGMIMSKGSDGSVYVVVDQNESKGLGKVTAAAISKFGFDATVNLAKQTTAQHGIAATKEINLGAQAAGVETSKIRAGTIGAVGVPGEVPILPVKSP